MSVDSSRRAPAHIIRPLALALVVAAVYANSLSGGFHFDDWHVLEQNPAIRSLRNVPRFFVDPTATSVLPENRELRPVLLTTFALNHALSGSDTWSYHAVNIVLHWVVVLLVFRIVRDHLWLGAEAPAIATAAALVVAVHPLNTEAVDYLSARSALLTAVLYLAAFDAALRDRRLRCLVLFCLALLTKAIAVTLPLAVLAHWLLAPRRREGLPFGFLGALVVTAVAGTLYRALLLPASVIASAHQPGVSPWTYFMTEWSAYLYYLRLFLWPDALVVDRLDYPMAASFLDPQAWGSLLVLLTLGTLAWRARRASPALALAAVWYVVTLAPESTFFPLAEPVNEHRPYLAMLGLGTAAALALWQVATAVGRRLDAPATRVHAALLATLVCVLGAATIHRNQAWGDDALLWQDAIVKAPRNPRAWLNAGHAAMTRGHDAEAERLLLEAHRLSPCYAYVQMNLSALAAGRGHGDESLRWADEAVACNPGLALAHEYRAAALERLGSVDEALAAYAHTAALDPAHAAAWFGQGRLLERQAAWAGAAAAYERGLACDPGALAVRMTTGLLQHHRLGDPDRAVTQYRAVLDLLPTHYGAHYQLAVALLAAGDTAEARRAWGRFVQLAEAIGDHASIAAAPAALRLAAISR